MKNEKVQFPQITLAGISVRTNNKTELNPEISKIKNVANYYWKNQVAKQLIARLSPGITYAVYTDYASNECGDYTYFIGEKVEPLALQDKLNFNKLIIPTGLYQKFTTEPGKIPDIILSAWKDIWTMSPEILGGERNFTADFEVYDQRAANPNHAIIDIFINLKK